MNLKEIPYSPVVKHRAIELKKYNIKDMDSLHIALAESIDVEFLVSYNYADMLTNSGPSALLRDPFV